MNFEYLAILSFVAFFSTALMCMNYSVNLKNEVLRFLGAAGSQELAALFCALMFAGGSALMPRPLMPRPLMPRPP